MKIMLKDFPNNISIKLNQNFLKKLFKKLDKILTQRDLARQAGVTENTISQWKLNKYGINGRFIPLNVIKIIRKSTKISWGEIEKNLIEYKAKQDKKSIKNPTFPIKDSKELREIVIHIMADGCDRGYAAYYNHNENTKKEFIKELKNVFGNVEIKQHWDHINFPMAIPYILSNYFKINFLSKKCRVPKDFFINKKHSINIIRAMIIDEGTVDGSNIRLDSCNKEFLKDIKDICAILNIKTGKTWESKGPIYRFNILAKSIQKVYKKISPVPIKNKEYLLKFACQNQNRNWKYELPGSTKIKIIKRLLKKPLTSVELSTILQMPRKIINKNTKKLESYDIIKSTGKKIYTNIYKIKNYNLAKKFIKHPEKFLKGTKLQNYGKTQLTILNILIKNKLANINKFSETIKITKPALYKCLKGMIKKDLIKGIKRGYYITKKGENILNFPEDKARYILYANIKNASKTQPIGFGPSS